jgi:phospholipase D
MRLSIAAILSTLCFSSALARETFVYQPDAAKVAVCFVPAQSCDVGIVAAIDAATTTIRVQAYGFTSPMILKALTDAKKRGVDVAIILDKSNLGKKHPATAPKYTGATFAHNAGIPVWIDNHPAIAHNKIIILDQNVVIGGSYNYTFSAEQRNAENVTYIDSTQLATLFTQNWESRKAVSEVYDPALTAAPSSVEAE